MKELTSRKVCPGQLSGVEELIQISFLGNGLQPVRVEVHRVLELSGSTSWA
jgi:hypothetical protein